MAKKTGKLSYGGIRMIKVKDDLYRFTSFNEQINLSFHQYLLKTAEPILFHTGNVWQAQALLPKLKELLDGVGLGYIFVSHFEADECGGLALILGDYPEARTICSEVTARQLTGFGFDNEVIIKRPGEKLVGNSFELEFISYPAEMHLWEGLLAVENQRGILFSSDLMIRRGREVKPIIEVDWKTEISEIKSEQIPDPARLARMQKELSQIQPALVAPGHGPCLGIK